MYSKSEIPRALLFSGVIMENFEVKVKITGSLHKIRKRKKLSAHFYTIRTHSRHDPQFICEINSGNGWFSR